jgi:hypothetical protein
MMREWHVELFQCGIRLTYDITVPEPGSYLLFLAARSKPTALVIAIPTSDALVRKNTRYKAAPCLACNFGFGQPGIHSFGWLDYFFFGSAMVIGNESLRIKQEPPLSQSTRVI